MNEECEICCFKYDIQDHKPRLFGKCGHTICNQCLSNLMEATRDKNKTMLSWLLRCPWDQEWYLVKPETTVNDFPLNRVFYNILTKKKSTNEYNRKE